jgi:predicted transcriptional regulator
MKQILVELDDRCARDLERVAPAKRRMRAEFVRLAIRQAIDRALDRATERAYRAQPVTGAVVTPDLAGWDPENELATPSRGRGARRARRG